MAAGARRSAHLAAVNAVTTLNRFSSCAFRNGKCGHAGLGMRALWRLRGHLDRLARRSRCARTWRGVRGTTFAATLINNPVNPSAYVVGDVERTVRPHRQAAGSMFGFGRRLHRSRETIRKYFALAGSMVPGQRLKDNVVTTLLIRRSIP